MPEDALRPAPQPRFGDHMQVLGVLLLTFAGAIPSILFVLLSPILTPWLRRRGRRRLSGEPVLPVEPPPIDGQSCAGRTIFLVAGEASGDELAARVVKRLKEAAPEVRVRGYGGVACSEAGAELDRDITANAVVGFFPVLASLGFWWRLCAETLARFREDPPDLLLTVDFPGLNVRLARWARKRGIRTVHLVAPQLWAHTPWRIFRWRRAVDLVLATFPFEPLLFERAGLHTVYVGHPLFEAPLPPARGAEHFVADAPSVIELWPGSRRRELARHAPLLVEAAADVEARLPPVSFVVRLAKPEHEVLFEEGRKQARRAPTALTCVAGPVAHERPLIGALASSGTATAQLAADLVPLTVFYRLDFISWFFAKALITSPWISLANLVLGRTVLMERLCFSAGAGSSIAADFLETAGTPQLWNSMQADLKEVRGRLSTPHVAHRAAQVVLAELAGRRVD